MLAAAYCEDPPPLPRALRASPVPRAVGPPGPPMLLLPSPRLKRTKYTAFSSRLMRPHYHQAHTHLRLPLYPSPRYLVLHC